MKELEKYYKDLKKVIEKKKENAPIITELDTNIKEIVNKNSDLSNDIFRMTDKEGLEYKMAIKEHKQNEIEQEEALKKKEQLENELKQELATIRGKIENDISNQEQKLQDMQEIYLKNAQDKLAREEKRLIELEESKDYSEIEHTKEVIKEQKAGIENIEKGSLRLYKDIKEMREFSTRISYDDIEKLEEVLPNTKEENKDTKTLGGEGKKQNNSAEPKSEPKQTTDKNTSKTNSNAENKEQHKQTSTEPKENEFNWDNFIKQYGGDRTNTAKTNPVPPQPTNSNNKEDIAPPGKPNKEDDKTKQEMDAMWEKHEKEQKDKIEKETNLAFEEDKQQKKANEREETPEEIEAIKKHLNGEKLDEIRDDKIGIDFEAETQTYRVINEELDSSEDFEMSIDEINNSKEFSDFHDVLFNIEEPTENIDKYLAFMLNKADNKWGTKKLDNYINAINGRGKLSKNTDIYYGMKGIYGKQYFEQLSNQMMKIANYHSDKKLATVEKGRWTKFLESKIGTPLRKGIFKAREIMSKIKKLPLSKKSKTKMIPSRSNIKNNIENNQITDTDIEKANKRKEEKVENFVLNIDPQKKQTKGNQTDTKPWDYEFNKMLDEIMTEVKKNNNTDKTIAKSNDTEVSNINEVEQKKEKEVIGNLNDITSKSLRDRVKADQGTIDKTNQVSAKHNQAPDLDSENIPSQTVDMQNEEEGPSMDD